MRFQSEINRAVQPTLGWATCILVLAVLASPVFGQSRPHRRQPTPPVHDGILLEPQAIQAATANELAAAMEIPQANIVSATLGTSAPGGVGTDTARLGRFFPRQGGSFALLSTGLAASAQTPNNSPGTSTVLTGLNTSQGHDMVQLRIVLSPPPGAQCLGFDFAFFSEEFPEYVGSPFNDFFLAELGGSNFTIVGNTITAPRNFAVDPVGNLISINSVFGVSPNTQSTYDGATSALRAVAPLNASSFPTVELVLTIADMGDSVYDSTVMLDNFAFSTTGCSTGAGLADMIISPQSGFITPGETFDLTLLASQPVTGYTVLVNGLNVSNLVAGCIRGTQPGGGSTVRCPGISGNILRGALGPGPFTFDVTANFANGTTRSETVTYALIAASDIGAARLAFLPASGPFAATQNFDLVVVVRPDVLAATVTVDGFDATGILLPCFVRNVEVVAGGAALAGRCPLRGGLLPPGPHVVIMRATFPTGVVSGSFIWNVRPNTEP